MAIIKIPRANDRQITFSLSSGATGITNIFFTLKLNSDIEENDMTAIISENATFTLNGDTLSGYVNLTHDQTDIAYGLYKYDFKLIYAAGNLVNTTSGLIDIVDRVTVRES